MILKRLILSFLLFCFSTRLNAQTYTINWEGSRTVSYSQMPPIKLPSFSNTHFVFSDGQIYLQNTEEHSDLQTYSIQSMEWETLPKNLWFDLDIDLISPDEDANISSALHPITKKNIVSYKIRVLKRQGKDILRLKSYTIHKNQTPKNLSKEQNTTQTNLVESPLATGNFYKIKVDKTGVFKITTEFLKQNGIDPKSINPKHLRIYGNGGLMLPEYNQDFYYKTLQENAIEVVGEDDEQWNEADYALFYAQAPNGFALYNRGNKRTETRTDRPSNVINIYEDFSYYFFTFDKGIGKRISTENNSNLPSSYFNKYDDYQFINEEKNNLLEIGRLWVGTPFTTPQQLTFNTSSPIPINTTLSFRARLVTKDAKNAKMDFSIDGTQYSKVALNNFSSLLFFNDIPITTEKNTISLHFTPDISPNPNAVFYLDYAEIQYKQPLKFNGAQLSFRRYDIYEGSGETIGFEISNAQNIERLWNVADPTNITNKNNLSTDQQIFKINYTANSKLFNNEFIAFTTASAYTPSFIGKVPNQNLASLADTEYLIITIPEFKSEAKRLAEYHHKSNQFQVSIVTPQEIYNEYSSGGQDITAIRNFISDLKNQGKLKYVLLLGDTSFDYKNRIRNNTNLIPSYESEYSISFSNSFVTDDYFVMTAPQNSTTLSNIFPTLPIGRLPAKNITEAKTLIDKTLAYYNHLSAQSTPFGEWKMNMDFVVDDDNDGGTSFHTEINSILKSIFEDNNDKKEYHIRKLYLDAFAPESTSGGQRYPGVSQGINTAMGNSLFLMYFGHGGVNGWAQERVLTLEDLSNFNNFNSVYSRFPLVSTITCEFTLWDSPNVNSVGEALMKLKSGGPSTMITSSRELGVSYGKTFSKTFLEHLLQLNNRNQFNTLGDAFLSAKIDFGAHSDHLKVNFLGDPAMRLTRPKPQVIIDDIIKPSTQSFRALDHIIIKGHIIDQSGNKDLEFNGKITVNIFDKFLDKKTRNNDGNLTPILEYKEEGNPIVKSSASVSEGQFELEFYIPKDIDFNIGNGRLLLYANNENRDAYLSETIKVGDINPEGINDNEPPKIKLFMNNTNFVDGGITNENPTLVACLTDDTGINATGAGIGHDITLVLDGEVINTKVLNDYFSPGEGNGCTAANLKDFQKGTVNYPFRNLKAGEHQLVLKVWDINNNSASAALNFVVRPQSEENLVVKKLLNWPNPFTHKTYIHFEHNCPDALEVTAQIYTITGKLVKTIRQTVSSVPFREGFRTGRQEIEWDGTDNYGAYVGKGSYIYKVFVKSTNPTSCKGSATQVEKMILLK